VSQRAQRDLRIREDVSLRAIGLCLSAALLVAPCSGQCAPPWIAPNPAALRVMVLLEGETDPDVARAVASLGANAVATRNPPDPATGANLGAAGLRYIAPLPVRDAERLPLDTALLARLRSIPALAGLEYYDDSVTEGYAAPETQARSYGILKALFPDVLVLYALRLDLVAIDPGYLDGYFRPEFTDLVVPYFYPVGSTTLGPQQESDAWEERLQGLLSPVAARMPAGQGILPVLQAFEQEAFPVNGGFLRRQVDVYAAIWPDNQNAATFAWTAREVLHGTDEQPVIFRSVSSLFGGVPSPPVPCLVPPRPVR